MADVMGSYVDSPLLQRLLELGWGGASWPSTGKGLDVEVLLGLLELYVGNRHVLWGPPRH